MVDLPPQSYCAAAAGHPYHGPYHDDEYGFPVDDDARLFERLSLEVNQAGLSWLTILKKREGFKRAFADFDPATVARFGPDDRARLLADAGIVRNRLKVDATIHNASVILGMRRSHGSFAAWLDASQWLSAEDGPRQRTRKEWIGLFKKTFRFTGGEITGSFLESTGYLPGAHVEACPVFARVASLGPPWMRTGPA